MSEPSSKGEKNVTTQQSQDTNLTENVPPVGPRKCRKSMCGRLAVVNGEYCRIHAPTGTDPQTREIKQDSTGLNAKNEGSRQKTSNGELASQLDRVEEKLDELLKKLEAGE